MAVNPSRSKWTPRRRAITSRVLANMNSRAHKQIPRGSARDVLKFVSLVEAEVEDR